MTHPVGLLDAQFVQEGGTLAGVIRDPEVGNRWASGHIAGTPDVDHPVALELRPGAERLEPAGQHPGMDEQHRSPNARACE